jgi:ArsR family transcriptional regulator
MYRNLEEELNQFHAEFCAGLADPTRLLILYTLADGPLTVGDLVAALKISQPTGSRHLKILRERGMVIATRNGVNVEYRLADERLIQALDLLRAAMRDQISHRAELIEAVKEI